MDNHKDLEVWRKSINLVKEIYNLCSKFPKEEIYGLTSQIRRAAVSIPSNIAEGAARKSKAEFKQFIYISLGSLSELETQLIICTEINYLSEEIFNQHELKLSSIRKMLFGLLKSIDK